MTQQRMFLRAMGVMLVVLLGVGATVASAQLSGPTQTGEICMQKVFGAPVTGSNRLNCTANDIRLSEAIMVSPDTCQSGSTFTLTATFETIVTANSRYDAGFFFRIDGGDSARGDGTNATGQCSLSALDPALEPGEQLDGDTCGDLNSGTYSTVTFVIPDVTCADTDGDGFLNLPNCTSWHSNQGTACNISQTADFRPDTKSKCVCDDDFQVPVTVEDAEITVTKTASPTEVPESGGPVTFTVTVTNDATVTDVTIQTIIDDIYGDLHDSANTAVTSNTCPALVGTVLGNDASACPSGAGCNSATCTFSATPSGNAGGSETDTVEVCGPQDPPPQLDPGEENSVCGSDDATVTFTNEAPDPSVTKDAGPTAATTCSLTSDVTYTVTISNPSTIDTLSVSSLTDSVFGDITAADATPGNGGVVSTTCVPDADAAICEVGGTLAPGTNCSCTFVGRHVVTGTDSCGFSTTNTVTADLRDTDAATVPISRTDGATVTATADVDVTFP
jgi:hypothetical protein